MKLHSIILGSGKPFLILHGFLGMADNWKTLGDRWAEEGYQVHLIDQRNHGRSPHSDEFSYTQMADDIAAYCKEHSLKDIILLGHSMGGKVAMMVADQHAKLIDKLIVADIAPKEYPTHHGSIIYGLNQLTPEKYKSRKQADEALAMHIKDWGTRQFLLKSLYRKNPGYAFRFNLPVLGKSIDFIGEHKSFGKPIEVDTLFVRGGKSDYITDADKMLIDHAFAKAELKTIKNAGHWLHAEKPNEMFNIVVDFIS